MNTAEITLNMTDAFDFFIGGLGAGTAFFCLCMMGSLSVHILVHIRVVVDCHGQGHGKDTAHPGLAFHLDAPSAEDQDAAYNGIRIMWK